MTMSHIWSSWLIGLASGWCWLLIVIVISLFSSHTQQLLSNIDRSIQHDISQICIVWESIIRWPTHNNCRSVELAITPSQQQQWLMNRPSLPSTSGMLFVFPQDGLYPFWMKNTLIPLDMIWIDFQSRIVAIRTAQPCTTPQCPNYDPWVIARYVLELNAGQAQERGLKVWDKIIVK